ncbi:ABC1-domain-containing protein [Calocera cornea HHB12733]|uniref:ABC1-domain-containing protein n=1 Tax=Calocera cornea HHB12733 TaxID=1353952 RepID=A0A165GJJ6_9BASI|nr:ABC1-domain-containing protein [Calocera cornea HHB12733]
MPSSLLDALSVVSSASRIARRSATIQIALWARRSRLPENVPVSSPAVVPSCEQLPRYPTAASITNTSNTVEPTSASASTVAVYGDSQATASQETAAIGTGLLSVLEIDSGPPRALLDEKRDRRVPDLVDGSDYIASGPIDASTSAVTNDGALAQLNSDERLDETPVVLKPSRVPSSRLARLFHYGGLAAGLGVGVASEFLRRGNGEGNSGSLLLSEGNVSRLVDKLSKMRGAALKLGQFLSIHAHVLPPQLESVFQQLQNKANYMPNWQMEQVMKAELGTDWRTAFVHFDPIPIASASIGQVHRARLADGDLDVAVKIQFPNVAQSITSDLSNLSLLLATSSLLPRGLFLNNTIKAMQQELTDECDYEREAHYMQVFADKLQGDDDFSVPKVVSKLTTKRVLVMDWMQGVPLTRAAHFDQATKNEIASRVLRLCLRELFDFSMMQTDPNWTNFMWNSRTHIELIDYGATREYSRTFIDQWLRLLRAAIDRDEQACLQASQEVGYLTGDENEEMVSAHLKSLFLLAVPFRESSGQPYQFSGQTITDQIKALIPVMLRHRLIPPPRETYSLNRMLSGAFLLCARLDAEVPCSQIWRETTKQY